MTNILNIWFLKIFSFGFSRPQNTDHVPAFYTRLRHIITQSTDEGHSEQYQQSNDPSITECTFSTFGHFQKLVQQKRELEKALWYSSYEAENKNEGIWCVGKPLLFTSDTHY